MAVSSVLKDYPPKGRVDDEVLIPDLARRAGHRSVWVTTGIEAQTLHAKLIMGHSISVVWLREPPRHPLTGAQELLLLTSIFGYVRDVVIGSEQPMRFQAQLKGRSVRLERLSGSLFDSQLSWTRVKRVEWETPYFPLSPSFE